MATTGVPCICSGRKGTGGTLKSRTPQVSSPGTVATCSLISRKTSFALVKGCIKRPPSTIPTGMDLKFKGCHYTEVPTATAHTPEEIRVLCLVGRQQAT